MSEPEPEPVSRDRLLDMMTAYKSTYVLRAALDLRVFDALSERPADADTVAKLIETDPRATRKLLDALASIGLLGFSDDQFRLAPGTERLLVTTSQDYFGGNIRLTAGEWEWGTMNHLADIVRAGGPLNGAEAEAPGFEFWVDFANNLTGLTKVGAQFVAANLVPWIADRETLDVLEVGCGHAMFGRAVCAEHPRSRLWCQDWPNVLEVTRRLVDATDLRERTRFIPGDAFDVPLGGQYDVIVLANFLLHFSARRSLELLRRLVPVLKSGGRMVIAGFTTGDASPSTELHANMLALLMLAGTSGGELHSSADYVEMLESVGLRKVEANAREGLPVRVVTAAKP